MDATTAEIDEFTTYCADNCITPSTHTVASITSTLVPTLFLDSVAVVILATVCVEGVMQLSAQSVVNSLIAAVVAAIVIFLLKGHSQIVLHRRSEESMKIGLPEKVQRTYEYAIV